VDATVSESGKRVSSLIPTPRKPREPSGNGRESSESTGNRSAGQVPFAPRRCWLKKCASQIPKPCVAGSNPAEGTANMQVRALCRPGTSLSIPDGKHLVSARSRTLVLPRGPEETSKIAVST